MLLCTYNYLLDMAERRLKNVVMIDVAFVYRSAQQDGYEGPKSCSES